MTIEYRTIDTATLKGLQEAERLHQTGWEQVRVGPFTTQYRSPKQQCPVIKESDQ